MKIKIKDLDYDQAIKQANHRNLKAQRPTKFFRFLTRTVSKGDLKKTHFTYQQFNMDVISKEEPCLILMNHSSFIDLEIAATIFADRPFNIVTTSDGFVGKQGLMQQIGCIPTNKFITDISLVKNLLYAVNKLQNSILMYPEASYSFDGTATPLPASIGKCIKLLKVPVVFVKTYGAFQRDPLYNNLQIRDVDVSADVTCILTKEEVTDKSADEITKLIFEQFSFDNFKWQQENKIRVAEPFRADFLNRVLYKCPCCKTEGLMEGKGIHLTCHSCGKVYELTEYGEMQALAGETEFAHIPDWYQWERASVREELLNNQYHLNIDVTICIMVNMDCIYRVGTGTLEHTNTGFHLTGCDGKIDYIQEPKSSYSLYADYFWYEIGDMICIGDSSILYYCFPTQEGDIVAKTRLATEELYKIQK